MPWLNHATRVARDDVDELRVDRLTTVRDSELRLPSLKAFWFSLRGSIHVVVVVVATLPRLELAFPWSGEAHHEVNDLLVGEPELLSLLSAGDPVYVVVAAHFDLSLFVTALRRLLAAGRNTFRYSLDCVPVRPESFSWA